MLLRGLLHGLQQIAFVPFTSQAALHGKTVKDARGLTDQLAVGFVSLQKGKESRQTASLNYPARQAVVSDTLVEEGRMEKRRMGDKGERRDEVEGRKRGYTARR